VEGAAPSPLAPATYKIVGLDEGVTRIHIPLLSRDYDLTELTDGHLELLERMGWPHVEKTIK
jgi:hypothetical protein